MPFDVGVQAANQGSAVGTWSISVALPDGGSARLISPSPFTSGITTTPVSNPDNPRASLGKTTSAVPIMNNGFVYDVKRAFLQFQKTVGFVAIS